MEVNATSPGSIAQSGGANRHAAARRQGRAGRRWIAALALVVGLAAGGGLWWRAERVPKRFDVVEAGRLYRSGEVGARQLRWVRETLGVRTVLCLLDPNDPDTQAEQRAAEALGIDWLNVPLRGNGASTPEARERIRALVLDPNRGPMLVHCAAGTNRTGLAIGMYRLHHDGWALDDVLKEMRRYDFEAEEKHQNLLEALAEEAELARQAALARQAQGEGRDSRP